MRALQKCNRDSRDTIQHLQIGSLPLVRIPPHKPGASQREFSRAGRIGPMPPNLRSAAGGPQPHKATDTGQADLDYLNAHRGRRALCTILPGRLDHLPRVHFTALSSAH